MLEARKLSDQLQLDQAGKMWSWLSVLVWLITIAVLVSVWIGANFEAPPADKSQEKMSAAHAQAVSVVANLNQMLAPEQELTPELFKQLAALSAPLADFGQTAAVGLRISPDSQDTQTWPGKINVMVGDLKMVSEGQESLAHYDRLRDALSGMYKPKGPLNSKLMAEGSASRGFYTATSNWVNSTVSPAATSAGSPGITVSPVSAVGVVPKLTWAAFAKGQPLWREINGQLDALELEAKQAEDAARAKWAKDTLALLEKNDSLQILRKADEAWSKMLVSQDRLKTFAGQLPPEPQVVLSAPSWHWSRLAYPGTSSEGMVAVLCMLFIGMNVNAAGYIARRNHLRALSQRWLAVTQQLETAVRTVDAPLTNSVQRMEALSLEFGPILDKLKQMQQALSTPAESPPKTMEAEAWNVALRMQSELESDLNLLREKLLNIHLQFCSGQTYENLVYDLAFTTEAVQTVSVTAKDLGRSVALLKDSLQQAEDMGDGQEIESLTAQVSSLRASAKRIALSLQELSDRLQVAVEDVPKGRRFEAERSDNETGRPSVNQSI